MTALVNANVNVNKEAKAINAKSDVIGRATKKMDGVIQEHLVTIARFINGNGSGNVTCATHFVNQLSSGTRTNAIKQWLLDFAGCTWNAEKKAFGRRKDFTYSDAIANDPANSWYNYVPEPEFKPVDGEALLKAALAKMKKALADTEHANQHKVDKALVNKLEVLLTDKAPHYVQSETEPKSEAPVQPEVKQA